MALDLRKRVRDELTRRGDWSLRRAYQEASANADPGEKVPSDTTLGRWLNHDGPLTANTRRGFSLAFSWPNDWPENPPPLPASQIARDDVAEIIGTVVGASESQMEVLADMDQRLANIERRLTAQAPPTSHGSAAGD